MAGGKVSLRPSEMGETIESLVVHEKLPKRSSADLRLLEFCTTGISSVAEALRSKPIAGVDQRRLSRYATKIALASMESSSILKSLVESYTKYISQKRYLEQMERKQLDGMLWGLACGYTPFVTSSSVHIWFWDESVKDAAFAMLSDAGIPKRFIYPFIASALSDIPVLGKMADDLVAEYRYSLRCLDIYAAALERAIVDISQIQC